MSGERLVIVLVLIGVLSSVPMVASANDQFEPNDDFGTATSLSPGTYTGLQLVGDESDFYAISVDAGDTLNVTVTVPKAGDGEAPDNDPDVELRDVNGDYLDTAVEETTRASDVTIHRLMYEADTNGTVYLKVEGVFGRDVTASYDLRVEQNANDRFEPNGNVRRATPLTPGTYENLTLLDDENDYYAIEMNEGETLNVTATVPKAADGEAPDNDPEVELLDVNGDYLDTAVEETTRVSDVTTHRLMYEADTNGTVYLRIYGFFDEDVAAGYDLVVEQNANDRFEPNGNIRTAAPLSPGTYRNLTILDSENDFYAISVDAGDTLNVTATVPKAADGEAPDNNPDVELRDVNGDYLDTAVEETTRASDVTIHRLMYEADSDGTVYLKVEGAFDNEVTANYDLRVEQNANDRFEPNGNIRSAPQLGAGTYENLTVLDDENDVYAISVTAGDTLDVMATVPKAGDGEAPDNEPRVELRDGSGSILTFGTKETSEISDVTTHRLTYDADATETVYLNVFGLFDQEVAAGYGLEIAGDVAESTLNLDVSPATVTTSGPTEITVVVTDATGTGVADATVTLSGAASASAQTDDTGTATLTANPGEGGAIDVTVSATGYPDATAEIAVREAGTGPSVGQNPAQDLDGDGTFEDVNGDGEFNIIDVGLLLQERNSDAVQNNVGAFDFNDDGSVNVIDVGKLLQAVVA